MSVGVKKENGRGGLPASENEEAHEGSATVESLRHMNKPDTDSVPASVVGRESVFSRGICCSLCQK